MDSLKHFMDDLYELKKGRHEQELVMIERSIKEAKITKDNKRRYFEGEMMQKQMLQEKVQFQQVLLIKKTRKKNCYSFKKNRRRKN